MFIRDLKDCAEFIAGDNSILREILHPDKADLTLRYSLAHATVRPGQTTKPHRLKTSEVYYIVAGKGVMHIDGDTGTVRPPAPRSISLRGRRSLSKIQERRTLSSSASLIRPGARKMKRSCNNHDDTVIRA
jgi:hypothetical protein